MLFIGKPKGRSKMISNRDSLWDSFKRLVVLEILNDLPFGYFQSTTLSLFYILCSIFLNFYILCSIFRSIFYFLYSIFLNRETSGIADVSLTGSVNAQRAQWGCSTSLWTHRESSWIVLSLEVNQESSEIVWCACVCVWGMWADLAVGVLLPAQECKNCTPNATN